MAYALPGAVTPLESSRAFLRAYAGRAAACAGRGHGIRYATEASRALLEFPPRGAPYPRRVTRRTTTGRQPVMAAVGVRLIPEDERPEC
ncbi:hypothetical protein ACLGI4_27045 [Streptomyces sp. HMX112]|uniref:hypothetical protein n=1 Tax=Streptomyces sp. HMX112 TaxID=3390850 RepID=UPI003A7F7A18